MQYTINALFGFIGGTTIIVASEASIRWNNVTGVNSLKSPGQVVPLLVGISSFGRVMYTALCGYLERQKEGTRPSIGFMSGSRQVSPSRARCASAQERRHRDSQTQIGVPLQEAYDSGMSEEGSTETGEHTDSPSQRPQQVPHQHLVDPLDCSSSSTENSSTPIWRVLLHRP